MNWAFLLQPEFARLHRLMARTYQTARREPGTRFDFDSMLLRPELYTAAAAMFRQAKGRNTPGQDGLVFDDLSDQALADIVSSLVNAIATGTYAPDQLRWVPIRQGEKDRFVAKLTVRDALLNRALLLLLTPICDADLPGNSYGYRRGITTAHALEDLRLFLEHAAAVPWFVRADIRRYFDEIPHVLLLRRLRRRLRGGRLLRLLERQLRAWARVPGRGVPQGAPLSPVLANWFLSPLDQFYAGRTTVAYLRYADDLLIVGTGGLEKARAAEQELQATLEDFGLRANKKKSRVTTLEEGTQFLGGRITVQDHRVEISVTDQSLERLERKIAEVAQEEKDQKGQQKKLQSVMAGWVGAHRFDTEAGQRAQKIVERTTGHRLAWRHRRSTTSGSGRRVPSWTKPNTRRETYE